MLVGRPGTEQTNRGCDAVRSREACCSRGGPRWATDGAGEGPARVSFEHTSLRSIVAKRQWPVSWLTRVAAPDSIRGTSSPRLPNAQAPLGGPVASVARCGESHVFTVAGAATILVPGDQSHFPFHPPLKGGHRCLDRLNKERGGSERPRARPVKRPQRNPTGGARLAPAPAAVPIRVALAQEDGAAPPSSHQSRPPAVRRGK